MPTLAATSAWTPSSSNRSDSASMRRSGGGDRVLLVGDVLANQDELVAAEARRQLVAAERLAQALGDGEQEAVAGVVAEAVVDDLEAVEVDEQDGDLPAGAVDAGGARLGARMRARPGRVGWTSWRRPPDSGPSRATRRCASSTRCARASPAAAWRRRRSTTSRARP